MIESDTESIPSPCKNHKNADETSFKIKSLEELRLEQIQKHDAALYQYDKDTDAKSKVKRKKKRFPLKPLFSLT